MNGFSEPTLDKGDGSCHSNGTHDAAELFNNELTDGIPYGMTNGTANETINEVTEGKANGIIKEAINGSSSGGTNGTIKSGSSQGRKRIVIVGLGMVAIAFMYYSSLVL